MTAMFCSKFRLYNTNMMPMSIFPCELYGEMGVSCSLLCISKNSY